MSTDREALRSFLLENAKVPEMVPEAMRLMEPFFKKAEAGRYELGEVSVHIVTQSMEAIDIAIGTMISGTKSVSAARLYPKPSRVSREAYEKSLWASLRDSLWASFQASIGGCLGASLGASLRASIGASLLVSLGASLWDNLRASLFLYLGFTLAGDREKVNRLTPLIELLPHAIPLGEMKDDPGTWLVLCA